MEHKKRLGILLERVKILADGSLDRTEKLGSICELLRECVEYYNWVGFYLIDQLEKTVLVLGPYAGEATEHTKILFGRGICGQAAEMKKTLIVQNVSKETNYLSCSPKVKAEIVIPIWNNDKIVGVLDIDSHSPAPFTSEDQIFLEKICALVSTLF